MPMELKLEERMIIVGKSGSGKSFFARALLSTAPRLIAFDPKGYLISREQWKRLYPKDRKWSNKRRPQKDQDFWALDYAWEEGYKRLLKGLPARVHIKAPVSKRQWEYYFFAIMALEDVYIYVDELSGVGPPSGSDGCRTVVTQGRQAGICFVAATQRPRLIPPFTISEAKIRVLFQTDLIRDTEYMAELMGGYYPDPPLTGHQLVIYQDGGQAVRWERIEVT
jgi:DNA helicase HerA-like ATPase